MGFPHSWLCSCVGAPKLHLMYHILVASRRVTLTEIQARPWAQHQTLWVLAGFSTPDICGKQALCFAGEGQVIYDTA